MSIKQLACSPPLAKPTLSLHFLGSLLTPACLDCAFWWLRQNEVAAMAKLSVQNPYVMPLYCAMQDDEYVYLARAPKTFPNEACLIPICKSSAVQILFRAAASIAGHGTSLLLIKAAHQPRE